MSRVLSADLGRARLHGGRQGTRQGRDPTAAARAPLAPLVRPQPYAVRVDERPRPPARPAWTVDPGQAPAARGRRGSATTSMSSGRASTETEPSSTVTVT